MINNKKNNISEPRWQIYQPDSSITISSSLLEWLLDGGSLTKRLKNSCSKFVVKVLRQVWEQPAASEAQQLNLSGDELAFIREVELHCDDEPWVFARSIMPASTLTGKDYELSQLGDNPLGELLFNSKQLTRGNIEIAAISSEHKIFNHIAQYQSNQVVTWGRRSIFYLAQKPLLVNEIMLPTMPCYHTTSAVYYDEK